jgi:hypothetical protein
MKKTKDLIKGHKKHCGEERRKTSLPPCRKLYQRSLSLSLETIGSFPGLSMLAQMDVVGLSED